MGRRMTAMTPGAREPVSGTDLAALHEALDAGARAAFLASSGDAEGAAVSLKNASSAAEAAFPAGSRETGGLSAVLDAIGAAAAEPACAGAPDPDLWFRPRSEEEAKAVCAACPVRAECLQHAIDREEAFGVWGGLDPSERRLLIEYGKTLTCGGCDQDRSAAEFGSDGNGGHRGTCLGCTAAAERERRHRRKERYAAPAASGAVPPADEGPAGGAGPGRKKEEKNSDRC